MSEEINKLSQEKVKIHLSESFNHLRKALDIREKLLLRQYELLLNSKNKVWLDDVKFLRENENDVLNTIRSFGRFNFTQQQSINKSEYHNDDYICPQNDHEIMDKFINENQQENKSKCDNDIVIDFSSNTKNHKNFLKENADFINESIINITLNESKKLIDKFDYGDRELLVKHTTSSSSSSASSSTTTLNNCDDKQPNATQHNSLTASPTSTLNKSLKNISNLTINNCTGNINLKNISNLTINTCKNDLHSAGVDNKAAQHISEDIECNFYNRLLTETKLLKTIPSSHHQQHYHTTTRLLKDPNTQNQTSSFIFLTSDKLNFMDTGSTTNGIQIEHPIQVQQWLKEIIYETDTEPFQNIEILEHSNIDNN